MEILRFLLSFLVEEFGLDGVDELKSLLSGDVDFRTFLNGLTPEKLAPILRQAFSVNNNSPSETHSEGLTPIESIADKDIILALNEYFVEV